MKITTNSVAGVQNTPVTQTKKTYHLEDYSETCIIEFRQFMRQNNISHIKCNRQTLEELQKTDALQPLTFLSGQITVTVVNKVQNNIVEW